MRATTDYAVAVGARRMQDMAKERVRVEKERRAELRAQRHDDPGLDWLCGAQPYSVSSYLANPFWGFHSDGWVEESMPSELAMMRWEGRNHQRVRPTGRWWERESKVYQWNKEDQ